MTGNHPQTREITCIVCPNGCRLTVTFSPTQLLEVQHALCPRGSAYARAELFNPQRTLTSTVPVTGGVLPLVSVRSTRTLPRKLLPKAVKLLSRITLNAPVTFHQLIVPNILGTGVDIIATREIPAGTLGMAFQYSIEQIEKEVASPQGK
jgi:CxxC motif-containing protein